MLKVETKENGIGGRSDTKKQELKNLIYEERDIPLKLQKEVLM